MLIALIISLSLLVPIVAFLPMILRQVRKGKAEREGKVMIGTVREVHQTGTYINNQPLLRVLMDAQSTDGTRVQTTVKQVFSLIDPPTPGNQIAIVLNPANPAEAFVADQRALQRDDRTAQAFRAAAAIPPEMADSKQVVGDIVAIAPLPDGRVSCQVSVVRIGRQPDTVFCNQTFAKNEPAFAVGDRVYLLIDSGTPPRSGYILPPSFMGGYRIPSTGNRVDGTVLANDLLFAGAKAQGAVQRAEQQPLSDPRLAAIGVTKWSIDILAHPENGGQPFSSTVQLSCSTVEKAAVISQVGARLPMRYDPNDPQTMVIDTISLGWGDPRLAVEQMQQRLAASLGQPGGATGQ